MDNIPPAPRQRSSQLTYWLGVLFVFLGACGFSTKAVLIKLAYLATSIDALSLLTLRMALSLPIYGLVAWGLARRSDNVTLTRSQWLWIAALGLLGYYVSSLLDFMGLQYISAGVERLILFIYPTIVLVMNSVLFAQRIKPIQYLALLLTYVGISFAFMDDVKAAQQTNLWLGAMLIFACSFTFATYLVGAGRFIVKVGSMKFTCYAMFAAGVGVFVHFGCTHKVGELLNLPNQIYWIGVWMALFATVIPTFMTAQGIKWIGADNAAIVGSVGPVVTIFMAYSFLGESITTLQVMGTVFVMAGVLMISLKGGAK